MQRILLRNRGLGMIWDRNPYFIIRSSTLSKVIKGCFSSSKPFQISNSIDDIWNALEVKIHLPATMKKASQEVKNQFLIQKIDKSHSILTQSIEELIQQIVHKKQQLQGAYQDISIKVEQLLQEYQNILSKIQQLKKGLQACSEGQLVQIINLIESVIVYLSEKDIRPTLHSKYLQQHIRYAFYIEACCKIRDTLDLIASFQDGTSLYQLQPQTHPELWKKITIVDVPMNAKSKEFIESQLFMRLIAGATSISKPSTNPVFDQFNFIMALMKAGFGMKVSLLRSVEMHYRGDFDKILKQVNLIDYGIFKAMNEGMCTPIATNTIIYIPFQKDSDKTIDIFQAAQNSIPVRVLHFQKILKRNEESDKGDIQDIVIHMHGGGYVAMSSNGTQIYTREWANTVQVPVFSIDYRLAPAHPFPQPIEDCMRVYEFITQHIHNHYRITPKNIYVGGDSGGGNLSCALTTMVMKKGLLKPKGLHLVYPSLDSRLIFYGSRKFVFYDFLLWPSLIKIAYKSYFPQKQMLTDPLASPLLLNKSYFTGNQTDKQFPSDWPATYMEVGIHDTLRDDCFLFLNRLQKAGVRSKLFLMAGLRHGYLNTETMLPSSKGICRQSGLILKELIEQTKKSPS